MSRNRAFCSECRIWTMHEYEYFRQAKGATVIVTCIKCGNKTESYKEYKE